MTVRFDGRVAIVTGAGGGLGRLHALGLAARGAKVVVNDLGGTLDGSGGTPSAAQAVVDEIRTAGGDAIASGASVTDFAAVQTMVGEAMQRWGRVDILVNNAGILRDKSFSKLDIADIELVIQVHLMGTIFCTKAVWPIMMEKKYGRIVVTTSGSGLTGNFGQSNYGAAKMGVVGLMNTLEHEGARSNIRINAISPMADTRMTGAIMDPNVQKYASPDHIAAPVAWLSSEDCNVSGEIVCAMAGSYTAVRLYQTETVRFDPANPATLDQFAEKAPALFDFEKSAQPYAGVMGMISHLPKAEPAA